MGSPAHGWRSSACGFRAIKLGLVVGIMLLIREVAADGVGDAKMWFAVARGNAIAPENRKKQHFSQFVFPYFHRAAGRMGDLAEKKTNEIAITYQHATLAGQGSSPLFEVTRTWPPPMGI